MNQTGSAGQPRLRLFAGLFALLPILGADQAEVAVREGNALYQSGHYEAALRRYEAAAEELPGSAVIEFNRGDALFKTAIRSRRSITIWLHSRPTIRRSPPGPNTTSA